MSADQTVELHQDTNFRIDDEIVGVIPPLKEDEADKLEASLLADGCRDPLVVWQEEGILLDGHNRYRICQERHLAYKVREISLPDRLAAKIWIRQNQAGRRNLTDDQRAMNAAALAELLSEQAKQARAKTAVAAREVKAGRKGPILEDASASKMGGQEARSRAKAAKSSRVSERKIRQAREVRHKAPELAAQVEAGTLPLAAAAREVKKRERAKERPQPPPLDACNSQFQVIYADPPWRYDFSASGTREIENQYDTLDVEQICGLPVPAISQADSVLFLWATSPKLPEGLRVMSAWGFTYKTAMVWVKDKIGMGYYARQRHEFLLIGTKGKPPVPSPEDRPDSVVEAPRGRHSEKPDRFYEIIEAMYPNAARVELFARKARTNWSAWGNETI